MKYLLDTNIWLERLLKQDKMAEVTRLLEVVAPEDLALSDFSLHSIGIILFRLKKKELFDAFASDVLIDSNVWLLGLDQHSLSSVAAVAEKYRLDFDDAYQLALALENELQIVSLDSDFDRTPQGRITPAQILG